MSIRIGTTVALTIALALASASSHAWAKPGFYVGVGGAQQTVGGDFDGTKSYADPSGSPVFIAGKMDAGSGIAAQIGYGFGPHFGLEYLYADTQHKATSTLTPNSSNAEFISQVIGTRLTAPFSKRFEGFLRAGYGLYEMAFNSYSANAQGTTGTATFTGTGYALGVGFELFFDNLGVGLGYTQHHYSVEPRETHGRAEPLPQLVVDRPGVDHRPDVLAALLARARTHSPPSQSGTLRADVLALSTGEGGLRSRPGEAPFAVAVICVNALAVPKPPLRNLRPAVVAPPPRPTPPCIPRRTSAKLTHRRHRSLHLEGGGTMRIACVVALAGLLLCTHVVFAAQKPKRDKQGAEACTAQSVLAKQGTWKQVIERDVETSSIIPAPELAATLKQMEAYADFLHQGLGSLPGYNAKWHRSVGGRLFDNGPAKYQVDAGIYSFECDQGTLDVEDEHSTQASVHINTTWQMSGPGAAFVIGGKRHYQFGTPIGDVRGFPAFQTDFSGIGKETSWVVLVARPGKNPFVFATRRQILDTYLANNEKKRAEAVAQVDKYTVIRPKAAQDADKQKDLTLFLKGAKDDSQRQKWTERFEKDYQTDEQKRDALRAKMTKVFDKQGDHIKTLLARDPPAQLDQVGMTYLQSDMGADERFDFKRTKQEVCGKGECGEYHGRPYGTPNLDYYNPADPVSKPQFFIVAFEWSAGNTHRNPRGEQLRDDFFARFDFDKLVAILGQ